jgi:hypothetical protein
VMGECETLDGIGAPSIFKFTRKGATLVRYGSGVNDPSVWYVYY